MRLLSDGAEEYAGDQHREVAQGPGEGLLAVMVERLFLAMLTLLVLFSEGTGKWGHGKKCYIISEATWQNPDSPEPAWQGARMLPPQEGHPFSGLWSPHLTVGPLLLQLGLILLLGTLGCPHPLLPPTPPSCLSPGPWVVS